MRAQGFGELEFALAEGARGAVEDEADEEPPVDVDRQGHGVADADRAVIVVVERRLHEGLAWNEIADSPGHRRWIASMCTDQRMLWKVAICRAKTAPGASLTPLRWLMWRSHTESGVSSEPITAASEATPPGANP